MHVIARLLVALCLLPEYAHAATAFVQGVGNASGAAGTTITGLFPGSVTSGNGIALAVAWSSATETASCADNLGNTYTGGTVATDATNAMRIQGFYAQNITGGTLTITCTISASVARRGLVAHEVSGTATSSISDGQTSNSQQDVGTGTDAVTSTAVTTTQNGDYVFGASADMSLNCNSMNAGTGYTIQTYSGCAGIPIRSESQVQTTAGSIAATFTCVGGGCSTDDYSTVLVALKAAATATTPRGLLMGVLP